MANTHNRRRQPDGQRGVPRARQAPQTVTAARERKALAILKMVRSAEAEEKKSYAELQAHAERHTGIKGAFGEEDDVRKPDWEDAKAALREQSVGVDPGDAKTAMHALHEAKVEEDDTKAAESYNVAASKAQKA